MSYPEVPESISTATLQGLIPNAQKPTFKPLVKLTNDERLDLLTQSVRNIYNAYQEQEVAYKDLAKFCVNLLLRWHEIQAPKAFEQHGYSCSSQWVKDQRDLEIIECLLRQLDMGTHDTLYSDN